MDLLQVHIPHLRMPRRLPGPLYKPALCLSSTAGQLHRRQAPWRTLQEVCPLSWPLQPHIQGHGLSMFSTTLPPLLWMPLGRWQT